MDAKSQRTQPGYWDDFWAKANCDSSFDPERPELDNHMVRLHHEFFRSVLTAPKAADPGLLFEAGCGGSNWLPYFAKCFGFKVAGMDYSLPGCEAASRNLARSGIEADVRQADLFNLPEDIHECADVVFSAGLAEHFSPTESIITPLASLARPGGLVLTLVPNMRGLTGLLQRLLDKEVYDTHVPLSPSRLAKAHAAAGLQVQASGHLGTLNLSVVNLGRRQGMWWYRPATRLLAWTSKVVWLLERAGMPQLTNGLTSPVVFCVARKPSTP